MYEITVVISFCTLILGTFWYIYLILKDEINPPLGTFIIVSAVFVCSFAMYMQNPKWSFTANIGLVGAIVSAWGVLVVLVTKLLMEKRFGVEFTRFQKWTVAISGIILIFWCITEDHLISYSLLQLSALIAYIPVIKKLWGAKHNPESLIFWGSLFLSTCVASYAAWERQDLESWIYIGRAIPASGTVLFLLIRLQLKYGS